MQKIAIALALSAFIAAPAVTASDRMPKGYIGISAGKKIQTLLILLQPGKLQQPQPYLAVAHSMNALPQERPKPGSERRIPILSHLPRQGAL